jgi:hypothetical protein
MRPYTLRISFCLEVEPRLIIKFLRFTRMKWLDFCYELTFAFAEEVCIFASVKRWIHSSKTGRTIASETFELTLLTPCVRND